MRSGSFTFATDVKLVLIIAAGVLQKQTGRLGELWKQETSPRVTFGDCYSSLTEKTRSFKRIVRERDDANIMSTCQRTQRLRNRF